MTKPAQVSAETHATTEAAAVDAEAVEVVEPTQDSEELADSTEGGAEGEAEDSVPEAARRINGPRVLAYGVLPGLALLLGLVAGFLKWQGSSVSQADLSRGQAIGAARDSTVALLSYRPDTVERDLGAARDRLTGRFKDAYTSLTRELVIPGSKQKQISAVATVQAAAAVSAGPSHGVVLLFVNQTTIVGTSAPTYVASSVRVTLDKIDGRWLISGFDPV
jgi:Mce-associated membrane protein